MGPTMRCEKAHKCMPSSMEVPRNWNWSKPHKSAGMQYFSIQSTQLTGGTHSDTTFDYTSLPTLVLISVQIQHIIYARGRNEKRHTMHENQHDMQFGVPLASQKLWNNSFPLQIGLSEKVWPFTQVLSALEIPGSSVSYFLALPCHSR